MDIGDGLNNETYFWRDEAENTSQGDSSLENWPFKGFEKEPKVVIEKFDIEPFITKKTLKFRGASPNPKLKTLPQLVSGCFVKLINDDLEQLKKDVLENSRLNKSRPKGILIMPFLRCKICEKAYSSDKKLQNHLENKHMLVYKAGFSRKPQKKVSFSDYVIVHEIREYHRCRKCTKIFEKYKSLKSHMKQEHRKRKCYICHYCSKNFVDRMFFKVHIKNHCDVCGLLLPNKRSYLIHRRDRCRILKRYSCKTCERTFFSYMDVKDHSYDHLEGIFICDICKDQHNSKCSIAYHILLLHSKRRPKELYTYKYLGNVRLYLCNFCETSSIDREVLEKHVFALPDLNNRKRTGYKDCYFCDQCSRKFDTESNMLKHKWSHFLNTSENSQVRAEEKVREENNSTKPQNGVKKIYKIYEKLPILMQPNIVLERIDYVKPQNRIEFVDSNNIDSGDKTVVPQNQECFVEVGVNVKKAIVDAKSKKTLISKFQCEKCHKFYSSNYCLNRHILTVHNDYSNLRCNECEETFVWPSLLQSHRCIRMNIPEMLFDDARPEIQLSNRDFGQAGFDELMNITENDDYMNSVDFDIPAPIVQLTEYEHRVNESRNGLNQNTTNNYSSYKIVMQEVPIEF